MASRGGFLTGDEAGQLVDRAGEEAPQPRVGRRLGLARADRGDQPHQPAVGAAAGHAVGHGVELGGEVVGHAPAPALEPVVDELALEPHLDHRPVQPHPAGGGAGERDLDRSDARHLPAAAGQADLGRMDGAAVGLAAVVGEEQVDRLRPRSGLRQKRGEVVVRRRARASMPGSSGATAPDQPASSRGKRPKGSRGTSTAARAGASRKAADSAAVRQAAAISAAARARPRAPAPSGRRGR